MCVCVCVCVFCVCMCVCTPFTVKTSSVWISWTTREQINDVVLKRLFSFANSLYRYFRMKHLTFLTLSCSHTRSGQNHDLTTVSLTFRTWGFHLPFIRYRLQSSLHRKPICLWLQHSREGSQSN